MDMNWDQRYIAGDTPWDADQPTSELRRVIDEYAVSPCRVLEIACGTGTNAVYLASRGFDVTAVDIARTALDRARKRAADAKVSVRFVEADMFNAPDLGGPFPFIVDVGGYHALRRIDEPRLVAIYGRLLAPGGLLFILAGNSREPLNPGPPTVSEQEVRAAFGDAFDILQLREVRFDVAPHDGVHPLGWSIILRGRAERAACGNPARIK